MKPLRFRHELISRVLLSSMLACFAPAAVAFKLQPHASVVELSSATRQQDTKAKVATFVSKFAVGKMTEPVHEELTNLIHGCVGTGEDCANPDRDIQGIGYVMYGVRWNDDPPFVFERKHGNFAGCVSGVAIRLVTFPECWTRVYSDGRAKAKEGAVFERRTAALLYRSHFGDLQFLHSMASRPNEPPADTRDNVLMWAEFTWKIALGTIASGDLLVETKVPGMAIVFQGHGWDVMDLFATGNPLIKRNPRYLKQVAFGSLLHMVQDSFSHAHVERRKPNQEARCTDTASSFAAPGKIMEFHTYGGQDEEKHAFDDTRAALSDQLQSEAPNVIDVGKTLVAFFERSAPWAEVRPYIECIYQLDATPRRSSSGERYTK
jgi:hypothetical protein